MPYSITGGGGGGNCTAVSFVSSPASPQTVGAQVTLTASSVCPGTPEYYFLKQAPGGLFTLLRDWSTNPVAQWNTVPPSGTWLLQARVRNQGNVPADKITPNTAYILN
ncbi:MAG: hypothetical protein IPG50_29795 [Myxococcales bacterium]|nr:hypothetical protein [Myxococcales bacterium]